MKARSIACFVASMLVGGLAANASFANAADVRQHASACSPVNASTTYAHNVQGMKATGSVGGTFLCPHNSLSTGVTHTAANGLNVHLFQPDGNAASGAKACVTFWGSNGGACGAQIANGSSGNITLSPNRSSWNAAGNAGDFPYVELVLGPQAILRGYWVSN
jgi:hypothetical protein